MLRRFFGTWKIWRCHPKTSWRWYKYCDACFRSCVLCSALIQTVVLGDGRAATRTSHIRGSSESDDSRTVFFHEPKNWSEQLHWTSWTLAAEFLGVDLASTSSSSIQQSVNRFYGFCYGIELSLKAKTAYIIVPKCANNAILFNLRSSPAFSDGTWVDGMDVEYQVDGLQRIACHSYADFRSEGFRPFTAVSHPVHRLISAMKEIEMRESDQCKRNTSWCSPEYHRLLRAPLGSVERVTEFFKYLLKGRLIPISKQVFHMFAVSGLFRYVAGTRVVRLEKMPHSWTEFVQSVGLNVSAWHDICGHRYEFKNVKGATIEALASDPSLHKALCALYMVDYVNFDYELPLACRYDGRLEELYGHYLEGIGGS